MTGVHIKPERLFAHSARVQDVSTGFTTLETAAQSTEGYDLGAAYGILCNPLLTPSIKASQTQVIGAIQSFRDGIARLAGMPTVIGRTMAERDERNAGEIAAATRKLLGMPDPAPMPRVVVPGTSDPMPRVTPETDPAPMPRVVVPGTSDPMPGATAEADPAPMPQVVVPGTSDPMPRVTPETDPAPMPQV